MEQSFQLRQFLFIFKKRFKLLLFVPLSLAFVVFIIVYFFISPIYESRTDLLVSNSVSESPLSATDIETNLRLIKTYQFILESKRIRDKVVQELGYSYTSMELAKKLRIETKSDSQVISLYVIDSDPAMAATIVQLFAEIFQEEVLQLMHLNNITILTEASAEDINQQIHPKPFLYTFITYLVGFIFVIIFISFSEYFNKKLYTKWDIEKYLKIRVIGVTRKFSIHKKRNDNTINIDENFTSRTNPFLASELEEYRTIRTNIQFLSSKQPMNSILVTSPQNGEGKTMTSVNLALVMAMASKNTVLIDTNLRKPELDSKGTKQAGLSTYLQRKARMAGILTETTIPNLKIIHTGPIPPNPSELLSSQQMNQLLEDLKVYVDFIILDGPSLSFSDSSVLATKVDGCIFVVRAGETTVDSAIQGLEQLKNVDATMIGALLNQNIYKIERYGST